MITIDDIAKQLGVTKSTVSNAISGKRYVSPNLKERILKKCEEMDFKPNFFATNLLTGKTNIIGLFLQTDEKPQYMDFYNSLIKSCLMTSHCYGYNVMIYYGLSDKKTVSLLGCRKAPIDGAIILSPKTVDERVSSLETNSIPCVVIGKTENEINNFSYVDNDNADLVKRLTEKLISLNHKDIALINSESNLTISEEREVAFRSVCEKNNINYHHLNVIESTEDIGYEICQKMLDENLTFTAVITANDLLAKGFYDCFRDNKLTIGLDISIVCLGGEQYIKDQLIPNLSYAYQDYKEIGKFATELLIEKINQTEVMSKKVILKSKIFFTDSVIYHKKAG